MSLLWIPFHSVNIYFVLTQHELGEGRNTYLQKKVHILYVGYMVSAAETGERTAITEIALLTG